MHPQYKLGAQELCPTAEWRISERVQGATWQNYVNGHGQGIKANKTPFSDVSVCIALVEVEEKEVTES
jgi:hypothetical protein